METNKTGLNLYQKLLQIQISVMGLKKDKKSNTYEYVTGTKVFEHIKPLMNQYGLILKQEIVSIENERIDYKTGVGTQYEKPKSEILTKAMMRFTWIDTETGEKDENMFGANGQNDWEKGLGSALTYAERYFMLKYFHIATDEDDIDNPDRKPETPASNTPAANAPKAPVAPKQIVEPSVDERAANMLGTKKAEPLTEAQLKAHAERIKLLDTATACAKYYNALTADLKENEDLKKLLAAQRDSLVVKKEAA